MIYQDYIIIDSLHDCKSFTLQDSLIWNSIFTFVLIEVDTRKNLKQIEPIVRLNLHEIQNAKQNGDFGVVLDLLGDDDLVGIKRVSCSEIDRRPVRINFKGIHIFDSYNYQIEIESTAYNN